MAELKYSFLYTHLFLLSTPGTGTGRRKFIAHKSETALQTCRPYSTRISIKLLAAIDGRLVIFFVSLLLF